MSKTSPSKVAEKEPETRRIPSRLVNIYNVYRRQVETRARRVKKLGKRTADKIDELNEEIQDASDRLRDFLDQEYLRTGRDPERLGRHDRDPKDVIEHHRLESDLRETSRRNHQKAEDINRDFDGHEDVVAHRVAQDGLDAWLEEFCMHYDVAANDVDWKKGEMKIYDCPEDLPDILVSIPGFA